ncbi:VanZ family protein [Krasilnikovia sp. MM14-A1259]|uniref:VanZ family protein n=1 Tax=Krasilnikovia sp. MM14-A1259 TaxID=3373539 RepID=UPI00399D1E51
MIAFLLVLSIGGIVSLTLLPNPANDLVGIHPQWQCVADRWTPGFTGEAGQNVLLFVPLGFTAAQLPSRKAIAVVAAPFLVEGIQFALPWLLRSCDSEDLVNNLTGLAVGFIVGLAIKLPLSRLIQRFRSRFLASDDAPVR